MHPYGNLTISYQTYITAVSLAWRLLPYWRGNVRACDVGYVIMYVRVYNVLRI